MREGILIVMVALAAGCSGETAGADGGALSGRVFVASAPVAGARVHGIMVNATNGAQVFDLGTSEPTTSDGAFTLNESGNVNGVVLFEVDLGGATYVEPASGVTVHGDPGVALRGAVLDLEPGESRSGVVIDSITTLGVTLGKARFAAAKGPTLKGELQSAFMHLGAHFGDVELGTTVPADLTTGSAPSVTPEYRYGAVLSGLSKLAMAISEASNLPATSITSLSVTTSWAADLDDGSKLVFDGMGKNGPVTLGFCMPPVGCEATQTCQTDCNFSGDTPRVILGKYMNNFLADAGHNRSGLKTSDLMLSVTAIAQDDDAFLFSGKVQGDIDIEPPTIVVRPVDDPLLSANPVDGGYVKSSVTVRAIIDDNFKKVGMGSLPVIEQTLEYEVNGTANPVVLVQGGTHGLSALEDGRVMLEIVIQTSATNDGPLAVTFTGVDRSGNHADPVTFHVTVDNTPPVVTPQQFQWAAKARPTITAMVRDSSPLQSVTATIDTSIPCVGGPMAAFTCAPNTDLVEGTHSVIIRAVDAAGNVSADAGFSFGVDTIPPVVILGSASMVDESTIPVTFDATTGAPKTYGEGTALPFTSGATLKKFVTRMGASDPNPIHWSFSATDANSLVGAAQYTVSNGSTTYGPFDVSRGGDTTWQPVVTEAQVTDGTLETVGGTWTLTMRVRDVAGNVGTQTASWTHVPLAAPLEILRDDQVSLDAAASLSVKSLNLMTGDAAVAAAITGQTPLAIGLYRVRNGTNKPVNLAAFVPSGVPSTASFSYHFSGYDPDVGAVSPPCDLNGTGGAPCGNAPADYPHVERIVNGNLVQPVLDIALYDGGLQRVPVATGGATNCEGRPCFEFTIAATLTGPTPQYWLAIRGNLGLLATLPSGAISTFSVNGKQVVGHAVPSYVECLQTQCLPHNDPNCTERCVLSDRFQPYDAFTQLGLSFDGVVPGLLFRPALAVSASVINNYQDTSPGSSRLKEGFAVGPISEIALP